MRRLKAESDGGSPAAPPGRPTSGVRVEDRLADDAPESADAPDAREHGVWGRRVLLAGFLGIFVVLVLHNRYVFTTVIHDDGDFAVNSLLIDKARSFRLLVGNYSRQEFSHPGPVLLYVQAWGQILFYDWLPLARSPWGGQLLGILALNAALIGISLRIVYDHLRSLLAVTALAAVILAFAVAHPPLLSNSWMPYAYFCPFLLFTVAAASVASGQLRHAWAYALGAGLIVHGHVAFLVFAGPITVVVAVAIIVRNRSRLRQLGSEHRKELTLAGAVAAVFALPLVVDLVLHWPGQWDDYLRYSASDRAGGHRLREGLAFTARFWNGDGSKGVAAAGLLAAAAGTLVLRQREGPARRFFLHLLGAVAAVSLLFLYYALRGADDLTQRYIGYFYWTAPALVIWTCVAAAALLLPRQTPWRPAAGVALAAALAVVAGNDALAGPYRGAPWVPAVADKVEQAAPAGRTVVINFPHDFWPQTFALVEHRLRRDQPTCVADPVWTFMATSEHICTEQEKRTGVTVELNSTQATVSGRVLYADELLVVSAA